MNARFDISPHSIETEQAVLGGLLLDNDAIDRIGALKPADFYQHHNGLIYEHIRQLIAQQKPADVLTVFNSIQRADGNVELKYLNDLAMNTPSASNISKYADIVREKALLRGMLRASATVRDIVNGQDMTAGQKLDAAQAEFGKLADTAISKEPVSIRTALVDYVNTLDDRYNGRLPNPGIPTGLIGLDKLLNGGIRRGNLLTLGARPGVGKSAFGETIALNAAKTGQSVLFLSMEMPEAEIVERAIANVGKLSATMLASADASKIKDDVWPEITKTAQRLEELNFFIDDEPALSLLQVVTKARQVKRKASIDLLVVDYLQLMTGTDEKRYRQLEEITKGLKALAKNLNIAVVSLSQFSREIEKRPNPRPKLSDFRDSGSIEQDSDILLGLHRDEMGEDAGLSNYAELFVMKNRQGRTGKISLTYTAENLRFDNFYGEPPSKVRVRAYGGLKD